MNKKTTALLLATLLLFLSIFGWAISSQTEENEQVRYALPDHPTYFGPISSRITF